MNKHIISIDYQKCIGCGLCKNDCCVANIKMENGKAAVITQDCIECGHCVAVCPKNAVSMSGYDDQPQDVLTKPFNGDDVLAAIKSRRSVRKFKQDAVSDEIIDKIIEAGRYTPTAKNLEDVSYVVIRDEIKPVEALAVKKFRRLKKIAQIFSSGLRRVDVDEKFFFKGAPVAIVIVSKTEINGALAASNMALTAEACGLGVLYSGFFTIAANSGKLRKKLKIKGHSAVTTLVLGYSAVKYFRTAQRNTASVNRV